MKILEILDTVADAPIDSVVNMPFKAVVSPADKRGAALVAQLMRDYPDIPYSEAEDMLLSALWWLQTFGAMDYVERQAVQP